MIRAYRALRSHHETVFISHRKGFIIKICSEKNNNRAISLVAKLFIQSSCQITKTFFCFKFWVFPSTFPLHFTTSAFTSSEQCFGCSRRCASSRMLCWYESTACCAWWTHRSRRFQQDILQPTLEHFRHFCSRRMLFPSRFFPWRVGMDECWFLAQRQRLQWSRSRPIPCELLLKLDALWWHFQCTRTCSPNHRPLFQQGALEWACWCLLDWRFLLLQIAWPP